VHELSPAADSASLRPEQSRYRAIRAVLFVVLAIDVVMAACKGIYGYLTGSLGMLSDGLHSAIHAAGGVLGIARQLAQLDR
jgi:divalent metal cation (Fe/Co/Zn/Cd) transporter